MTKKQVMAQAQAEAESFALMMWEKYRVDVTVVLSNGDVRIVALDDTDDDAGDSDDWQIVAAEDDDETFD